MNKPAYFLKKATALFLTFVFLLNVVGYYGLFVGLQQFNTVSLNRQFDRATFDLANTFEIKIPLSVAYAPEGREFERVSGQFEYQGEFYQMVKQKLAHDTLTVVCLKDVRQKDIHQAIMDFVKTFTDTPSGSQQSNSSVPQLIKDYVTEMLEIKTAFSGWEKSLCTSGPVANFIPSYTSSILHPPERG